ncbi:MAG: hypothetical protein JW870_17860 [Candidatus Delongbacteria bacterium]|nr:hypothetical protein [Candidatus Delongbacteria bacterium]
MIIIALLLSTIFLKPKQAFAQINGSEELYYDALHEIRLMLQDSILPDFKRAVFLTENAYLDGVLDYSKYCNLIDYYGLLIQSFAQSNPLDYQDTDYVNVALNSAIFYFMADTIFLSNDTILHYPYKYDFDDFDAQKDWSSMFVCNLIETGTGNCHSMPFMYKILADKVGAKAYLALAPYHMYIKTYSEKSGWYNTELTSAMFPVDAWISASGYIQLDAIKNGIYMDTLSNKQSIAFCLFDLAKGYEKKFGAKAYPFIFDCLDLALEHYPNFVNAMIYKAELLRQSFDAHLYLNATNNFKDILHLETPKQIYNEMEKLYAQALKLGYREMPREMYNEWYLSLKNSTDKYHDKKMFHIFPNQ